MLYKGCLSAVQPVQYGVCPTGICPWPHHVCLVYGRNLPNRCSARAQVPLVCRRLPNLRRHVGKCSSQCHRPVFALSSRRRRLDECEPTTPERQLSSGYNMDRFTTYEVQILSSTVGVVGSARDIGVVIDSPLLMADHVASVCCSAHYHLRQIRPTLQSLSRDAAKTLVQAFISFPGLLQFSFVWHRRQLTSTTAVCTERSHLVNCSDW